jgi:hypothetical protein
MIMKIEDIQKYKANTIKRQIDSGEASYVQDINGRYTGNIGDNI